MVGSSVAISPHVARRARLPILEFGIITILSVAFAAAPLDASTDVIWTCLLLQYALLFASLWRPLVIVPGFPTYVSAEFFFLFWSYLLFFYPYQLHVLGILDISVTRYSLIETFPDQANRAIILSSIGMVAFRAGLRVLGGRGRETSGSTEMVAPRSRRFDQLTVQNLAAPLFVLQSMFWIAYQFFGWRAAGEGRYSGATTGGTVAQVVYVGITVLSMMAVALWICGPAIGASRRPVLLTLSTVLALAWAARLLFAGDRNSFMLIGIVAIGGLLTFRLRAGRWTLILLCAVAVMLYQAIEDLRAGRIDSLLDFFLPGGATGTTANDPESSFNISTITVRAALAAVPDQFDFGYGLYQLVGFAGVIPFIRGALISPDTDMTQSSQVLAAILLDPSANWGIGTTIISDVYMDFGFFGVPILLFALGLGVAYTQRAVSLLPSSPWRVVFYLVTMAFVAEMPRYAFAFPVRPLVWVLLFFLVVSLLNAPITRRNVRKNVPLQG